MRSAPWRRAPGTAPHQGHRQRLLLPLRPLLPSSSPSLPSPTTLPSSKAIVTHSFSQTLPNATFHPDTSLLTTAEDVDLYAGAPSPALVADDALALPDAASPTLANATAPLVCDEGQLLNCSHPAIVAAIKKFNDRAFRSLVFLAYETAVLGSKPNRCYATRSFCNRKEISWRRCRDYGWFRLDPSDNCTFKITGAGRFRFKANATRQSRGANQGCGSFLLVQISYILCTDRGR